MKNLSISEEFVLCILTNKGKIPTLNTRAQVCMVASALLDLSLTKTISLDNKHKVSITAELAEEQSYLCSLYNWLRDSKPKTLEKIVDEYCMSITGKKYDILFHDIGQSLIDKGCATLEYSGMLGKTKCFIPNAIIVDSTIQKIRAELLENGTVTDEVIALVSLLDKADHIKCYFSKYETGQLKDRIKEIRQSDSSYLVKQMVDYIDIILVVIAAT